MTQYHLSSYIFQDIQLVSIQDITITPSNVKFEVFVENMQAVAQVLEDATRGNDLHLLLKVIATSNSTLISKILSGLQWDFSYLQESSNTSSVSLKRVRVLGSQAGKHALPHLTIQGTNSVKIAFELSTSLDLNVRIPPIILELDSHRGFFATITTDPIIMDDIR